MPTCYQGRKVVFTHFQYHLRTQLSTLHMDKLIDSHCRNFYTDKRSHSRIVLLGKQWDDKKKYCIDLVISSYCCAGANVLLLGLFIGLQLNSCTLILLIDLWYEFTGIVLGCNVSFTFYCHCYLFLLFWFWFGFWL